jgi:uncharacterized membrane protein YkgB
MRSRLAVSLDRLDEALVGLMSAYGIHLLRYALAVVYLWFGGLKLMGVSPAAELVVKTVFWLPPQDAMMLIGGWEVLIGIGLLSTHPLVLRATLCLFWLQALGTFQVFVLLPQEAFQGGNPLVPTLEGQYAFKNLVLIAAGLVIGSTVRRGSMSRGVATAAGRSSRRGREPS